MPFNLKAWNGQYFDIVALSTLGLTIQLGHDGGACPDPSLPRSIVVYHTNGYHNLTIQACTCASPDVQEIPLWRQYLRAGWFPATTTRPTTAFSFDLLDLFHHLTLQSKINAYDFFLSLGRRTDNSGLLHHPSRYKQFSHAVRLWRHLQQLKWAGRGHDPAGVKATPPGALAVPCAACPHPGKNLPDDWELTPPDKMWLYTLYLMMDANFRCRCKDRGLDDVELAPGWSYYVHEEKFREHVVRVAGRPAETNTCSAEHNAILKANLRKEGYVASGIGAVLCARHATFRANGVGDMHLGEKFSYMDFLLVSTLLGVTLYLLVVSYDIACQYCKNFHKRLSEDFPSDMQLDLEDMAIRWAIPKNHIGVHGPRHSEFSLNLISNVGRMYGEGVESSWHSLNPTSMSTREMALATRHEVLNDHLGDWNWKKNIEFVLFLHDSLEMAYAMAVKQRKIFDEFSATFPPEVVKDWRRLLEIWSVNPSAVEDPFEEPEANVTVNKLRRQLAEEDDRDLRSGSSIPTYLDLTPSTFVQLGLDIEEQQRALRATVQGKSDGDVADIIERRNVLQMRIINWVEAQNIYMPAVLQLRLQTGTAVPLTATSIGPQPPEDMLDAPEILAECMSLWLPSSLPSSLRQGDLAQRLTNIERQMRLAQLEDSLNDIRRLRRVLKGVAEFKRLNVSGTGNKPNTRIRALYAKFQRKQTRVAERYRAAYRALSTLDPDGVWKRVFRELLDRHLTGPGSDDDKSTGEGHREVSWIWLAPRVSSDANEAEDVEYNKSMRAEWARAKARAERWEEEVELLVEEMRRVIAYFEWTADWWGGLVEQRANTTSGGCVALDVVEGIRAFASKRVAHFHGLALRCAGHWIPLLNKLGHSALWVDKYTNAVNLPTPAVGQGGDDSDTDDNE
ncbi:hypothetical protein C8Q73DRAFT_795737 [Cubamyces lactineus]|nr:hypothetical protein C8Q73DRAFT_795737 [Cubamyces lactineus]